MGICVLSGNITKVAPAAPGALSSCSLVLITNVNSGLKSIVRKERSSGRVVVVLPLDLLGAVFVRFLCSQLVQLLYYGNCFFSQCG